MLPASFLVPNRVVWTRIGTENGDRGSLRRLPGLALHVLARIAHSLALVGLGLADLADVGGDLADDLLVDPLHRDPGGHRHLEGDAVGRVDDDRVAEPEGEL